MLSIIYRLHESLGLEIDADDPTYVVDNDLTVYFNESADVLEMYCLVGALPSDSCRLQRALQFNYSNTVVLAADADNAVLIALLRFPETAPDTDLQTGFQQLVAVTRELRMNL
ncbi:hypothetical protein NTD84_13580 [Pseudomonas sp. 14P_8.1_Bac3]|uniref:hypothetical protein n=1 Tax=Pseudomonas sp. 14P_8.1_Bac3 TaxID=2971621 RepID=UPI0021C90FA2|nr:hypothetical protein [Pseudomonas sp. 14P_8.1_Bac3]MCU1760745.1 hypothetical protein [Pseudomonas sp. 14P_8.1_Bac3]